MKFYRQLLYLATFNLYQIYRQLVARRFQSITFIANSLGDKGPTFKPGCFSDFKLFLTCFIISIYIYMCYIFYNK